MNEVHNTIVDSCMAKIAAAPECAEWKRLHDKLDLSVKDPDERHMIFDVVWRGINLYGEAMFKLGWELRGNPDKLFELPQPE